MARVKLTGRIIRILDTRTVVINLGREHGITDASIFRILGEPEQIIDPVTNEVLGSVKVTKTRVRATQVFDKFTTASTTWVEHGVAVSEAINLARIFGSTQNTVDEGELNVSPEDIRPWKAKSESPVKVGDTVEVYVEQPETKPEQPRTEPAG
ncbi:MAG: hypothetical protein ABW208_18650 [Pyrinomonadaceae bacterium]